MVGRTCCPYKRHAILMFPAHSFHIGMTATVMLRGLKEKTTDQKNSQGHKSSKKHSQWREEFLYNIHSYSLDAMWQLSYLNMYLWVMTCAFDSHSLCAWPHHQVANAFLHVNSYSASSLYSSPTVLTQRLATFYLLPNRAKQPKPAVWTSRDSQLACTSLPDTDLSLWFCTSHPHKVKKKERKRKRKRLAFQSYCKSSGTRVSADSDTRKCQNRVMTQIFTDGFSSVISFNLKLEAVTQNLMNLQQLGSDST